MRDLEKIWGFYRKYGEVDSLTFNHLLMDDYLESNLQQVGSGCKQLRPAWPKVYVSSASWNWHSGSMRKQVQWEGRLFGKQIVLCGLLQWHGRR